MIVVVVVYITLILMLYDA